MIRLLTAIVATLLLTGCAANPAVVTSPTTIPTINSELLVDALGAIQTAAIALAPVDGIPASDVKIIVGAIPTILTSIENGQLGWVSAVDIAMNDILPLLLPSTQDTLTPYFDAAQEIITALYAQGVA